MRLNVRTLAALEVPRSATVAFQVVAFAVLTTLGAGLRVFLPGTPVPFTLQPYFVLLAGLAGGAAVGGASQALYVGAGVLGLPVFAGGAGLAGPTGGYLVGFVAAASLTGAIAGRESRDTARLLAAALAGMLIIYVFGAAHLVLVWRMPLMTALAQGVAPFVLFDTVKVVMAAGTAKAMRSWR